MRIAFAGLLLLVVGCGSEQPTDVEPSVPGLPSLDLSAMEPQVRELLHEASDAVVEDPDSAEAWGRLGASYDAHLLPEPATACYREAIRLDPEDFRWAYLLAVAREIQGAESGELIDLFSEANALDDDYAPAYVRLGDALWRRGLPAVARDALSRAIKLDPGSAVAHRKLGQVWLGLEKLDEARTHFEQAVELDPADRGARLGAAQVYRRLGRYEDADRASSTAGTLSAVDWLDDPIYETEVARRSRHSGRLFSRAMDAFRAGHYNIALADLELVVRARPEDASVRYWVGTCHQHLGQLEQGLEHLQRAVDLEGGLVPARVQLAQLLAGANRLDEAEQQARQAVRIAPEDASGYLALAGVLARKSDLEGARKARTAAGSAAVLTPGQRISYARNLLVGGLREAALSELRAVEQERSDDPAVRAALEAAYRASETPSSSTQ